MRKLRRKNFIPLFRSGTRYRTSVPCDLATVPVAPGDGILDFRFVADHRNVYRF